jgi:hypothetical protein
MRKYLLRLLIGALTFVAGVATAQGWFVNHSDLGPGVEVTHQGTLISGSVNQHRFPEDFYFPVGVFSDDRQKDAVAAQSYSILLAGMHEPSLVFLNASDAESYRLLWHRPMHPTVSIRLWSCEVTKCISVKQIGRLVFSPLYKGYVFDDTFTTTKMRELSSDEWNKFKALIEASNFWRTRAREVDPTLRDRACGIMEGYRNRDYNVVTLNSPDGGLYDQAGAYLMVISEISVLELDPELLNHNGG